MGKQKRKAAIVAAVISAAVLLTGVLAFASDKGEPSAGEPVALVNGESITAEEMVYYVNSRRASVISEFTNTFGIEYGQDFWNRRIQGQTPLELLRKQALADAVRLRTVLAIAKQEGVIQSASFAAIEEEMRQENARRKKAVANGEPIYGPAVFAMDTFVPFYQSKLAILLKEKLAQTVLAATEDQLKAHYEAYKQQLFPVEDVVRFGKAAVYYRLDGSESEQTRRTAQSAAEELRRRLAAGRPLTESAAGLPDVPESAITVSGELVLEPATASRMFKSEPQLYEALRSGNTVQPVMPVLEDRAAGCYLVAKITGREPGSYISFDQSRDVVKKHYLDTAFEDYVEDQARKAKVELLEGYGRIGPAEVK